MNFVAKPYSGFSGKMRLCRAAGFGTIKGVVYAQKDYYEYHIDNEHIAQIFRKLGLVNATSLNDVIPKDHRPCTYYEIPWSIKQADRKSKLAFLASYVDGDGSVIKDKDATIESVEIRFFSSSILILKVLKVLIADLGYQSILRLYDDEVHRLTLVNSVSGSIVQ